MSRGSRSDSLGGEEDKSAESGKKREQSLNSKILIISPHEAGQACVVSIAHAGIATLTITCTFGTPSS
jgi:hypothetical protein